MSESQSLTQGVNLIFLIRCHCTHYPKITEGPLWPTETVHPILQVNGLMPVNGIMPQWHLVTHPLELYAISRLCVQIDKQKGIG